MIRSTVLEKSRLAATLVAAALALEAGAAAPSPQAIATETLRDALAPALTVRGGTASVTVSPPDARRVLEPCNRMQGFMPPGSRLSGRTVVGVRCVDGASWQAFLPASVRVEAPIWQTTRALHAGDAIGAGDVVVANGALTAPDLDAATAIARAGGSPPATGARGLVSLDGRQPGPIGRVALRAVAAGRALTAADIRDEGRINAGDAVRVVYVGDGFSVSSEGHSVNAADPGAPLMVRLASGTVVNGTLRADHLVELPH